jgi:hypothetical protein
VTPRGTAALLWAATGALVFLVAHQAYLLVGGEFVGVGPAAAVAVVVFATTGAAAYYLEGRLAAGGEAGGDGSADTVANDAGNSNVDDAGEQDRR